jgi:hypothetical protein
MPERSARHPAQHRIRLGSGARFDDAADIQGCPILNPATMPGAVETKELVFCAAGAGHGALKLVYRRSWEKDQPPAETFSIAVTIKR